MRDKDHSEWSDDEYEFSQRDQKRFPLWNRLTHKYPVVYSRGEFTLQPMMRGIYEEWKNGIGWYDHVEKYHKEHGSHPEWFQKLIDDDKKKTDETRTGNPQTLPGNEENRDTEETEKSGEDTRG